MTGGRAPPRSNVTRTRCLLWICILATYALALTSLRQRSCPNPGREGRTDRRCEVVELWSDPTARRTLDVVQLEVVK